jgi:hypothetical protein
MPNLDLGIYIYIYIVSVDMISRRRPFSRLRRKFLIRIIVMCGEKRKKISQTSFPSLLLPNSL